MNNLFFLSLVCVTVWKITKYNLKSFIEHVRRCKSMHFSYSKCTRLMLQLTSAELLK